MSDKDRVFLYSKRAEIARIVYALYQNSLPDCDASRVHRGTPDTSCDAIQNAIHLFGDSGSIER